MKEIVDYIKYHGIITSIRDNVDKDYIWFDICQKELYKDKDGMDRNNLSFFSARIYIEYSYKINLKIGENVYVEGIPKGYIDKKGYRQNYIHVLNINDIEVNKENTLYKDGYWNGKKIPTEIETWNLENPKERKIYEDLNKSLKNKGET